MKNRVTLIVLVGALIVYFCTFSVGGSGNDQSQTEGRSSITVNDNGYDLKDNEGLITEFFTTLYDSQKNMESGDVASYFSDESQGTLAQTYLDDLIYVRNSRVKTPEILGYDITLDVEDVTEEDSTIYIDLVEDQELDFDTGTSKSPGILSTIAIKDGKIASYDREEDLYLVLSEADDVQTSSEEFRSRVDKVGKQMQAAYENQGEPPSSDGYDRSAATDYASEYVLNKNPDYTDYDEMGGNCNNFISQCLLAGGIPIDGEDWEPDSAAWILVNSFYDYADQNKTGGLKADTNVNFFEGEPGDILQVGNHGEYLHSVIIKEVIKDENGKTVDYLVDSNSLDRENYPVSNYGYSDIRLIKILGPNSQ